MILSTALASGFWLFAETAIVAALITLAAHFKGTKPWAALLPYLGICVAGFYLIVTASSTFADLGTPPFGRRLLWNLLCTFWILLEWSIFYYILVLRSAVTERYLGMPAKGLSPSAHQFGLFLILLGFFAFHYHLYQFTDTETILANAYLFVRISGFAYVFIECGIAVALYHSWKTTRRLAAEL